MTRESQKSAQSHAHLYVIHDIWCEATLDNDLLGKRILKFPFGSTQGIGPILKVQNALQPRVGHFYIID